jgi:chloride channel protein, CIC family
MLMVVEMTGSVSVLAPGLIAVGLAWLIVRHTDDTMYRSQLTNRADTTAARILVGLPLLTQTEAGQVMRPARLVLDDHSTAAHALQGMADAGVTVAPVVDANGHFDGTITSESLIEVDPDQAIRGLANAGAPVVTTTSRLDTALEALTTPGHTTFVPVVDDDHHVQGTLTISDLVRAYRTQLLANQQATPGSITDPTLRTIEIGHDSPLAGRQLRHAQLGPGVVVVSIQRDQDVLTPTDHTTVRVGDQLTIVGKHPQSGNVDLGPDCD